MGAEAGGWDWWLGLLAVAGSIAAVVQVLQHYADPPERVEGWVERDPEFRAELAGRLRGAKVGSIYRDLLTKGLNWLDQHWGERGSARAFGVCIIIALCYTYAAFFLAWGVGGPGYIGGTRLADGSIEGEIGLLGDADQPVRGLLALWLVAAPALGFVFGRWLGRQERRLKARLRRRYRWRRRRFEIGYRAVLVVIFVSAVAALAAIDERLASRAGLFALLAAAPIAGIAAARRSRRDFSAGLLAAGAGTGAFAVGLALAVAFAITFAGDEAGAVTVAVAVAGAVTFAEAYAVAVPYPVAGAAGAFVTTFVAVAVPIAGASAAAVGVAGAGGVGAATAHRSHRGAFAGGLGAIVAFGIIATGVGAGAAGESAVVLLVFLFVLPVINGFWDWLSWWITRLLGRHLLATLAPARALGGGP